MDRLEKICTLPGTSGNEDAVREYIISEIKDYCEYKVDNLGNIIAFKKGNKAPDKKIMLCAHMDEVGFIITYIRSDGTLKFSSVGGIDAMTAVGRAVTINGINGVIGSRPIHVLSSEEREKAPEFSSLYIDIGAENKEEAEKYISLGDRAVFKTDFYKFGEGMIKGKAIDDRFGCEIMIDMIKSDVEYDCYFVFTVMEEIGARGARVAAFALDPDIAIVLEATTAGDVPGAAGEKRVCELGKGAVVSFMDRSTIYDRELYRLAMDTAAAEDIPVQTKTMVAGGNDSGVIHVSVDGVRTLAISAPCRYLHSPACVVKESDLTDCRRLAEVMLNKVAEL